MPTVIGQFGSFQPGPRLIDGADMQELVNFLFSTAIGIVAKAGGGQAGATPLTAALNRIDTVANANDSVLLPPALVGSTITVYNNTANSVQVFGSGVDTIAAGNSNVQQPTATGVPQATAILAVYSCFVQGQWKQGRDA